MEAGSPQTPGTGPGAEPGPGSPPPQAEPTGGPPPAQPAGAPPVPDPASAQALAVDKGARDYAMWTHLSALVGLLGVPSALGPLVLWLARRETNPYVDAQGKEALNFNLSALIYTLGIFFVGFVFTVVTLGLGILLLVPILLAVIVAWGVLVVIGAVQASKGQLYRYPLTIRFVT